MDNRRFLPYIIVGVVALLVIAYLSKSTFLTIEAGERGVIFRKFSTGLDKEHVFEPGFQIIAPWNEMYIYDVREQKVEETLNILDKNGLSIATDVSVRFHPIYDKIGYLHEKFGKDYVDQLVVPIVRSVVRKVMGRYSAEEIYSTKRAEVATTIIEETRKKLSEGDNNIQMTALLIRSIVLPEQIQQAIENKLKQEQEALAYQYKLMSEKSEAERKRIEAEGKARANKIINNSLTPELLKMRGIEATTELAKSDNAKVIVIGNSENGLPIILGGTGGQ